MIPSRYMLIDERSSYLVKRRARGRRDEKQEPAITLLPPDPYLIMEKPNFDRLPSPTMYRAAPPKSAKNKEASSFVILGETIHTPIQSRPSSPSGRVSPFRGHGFKSPNATRPNSRAASPSGSPRKSLPKTITDKPRISKDIGLPPKSPKSKKPKSLTVAKPEEKEVIEGDFIKTEEVELPKKNLEENEIGKKSEVVKEGPKLESPKEEIKPELKTKPNLALPQSKKPPVSPTPKNKPKSEKLEEKSVLKRATKPPVPPKKVEMKATLKTDEMVKQSEPGKVKETMQPVKVKETVQPPKAAEATQAKGNGKKEEKIEEKEEKEKEKEKKEKEKEKKEKEKEKKEKEKEKKEKENEKKEKENEKKEKENEKKEKENEKKEEVKGEKKKEARKEKEEEEGRKQEEKKEQKLIPCFQPDKCHIAPPTMASPSPIITPSISTPSTSADLASSSTKNSQSISAAPTTVTPSSFSSVSSTVVLSGNLARKEIEQRAKGTEAKLESRASLAPAKDPEPPPAPKASVQILKTQSKDSVSWSKKDNLSGEISSTTNLIKGEPEMEVLSPNNLRDSPPRAPPLNMAWADERLPNGDVPNKAEAGGKFRRFISAAWKFLSYLIYCRCLKRLNCCRRQHPESGLPPAPPKPSFFSKLNCFKGRSCPHPFKRCLDRCRSKCCDNFKCCREKSKPKSKSRKCCAKSKCCSLKGCCDRSKYRCSDCRDKVNNCCRSLFCLNLMCCQRFLRKFKFCHKFKCCQKDGFCSCCNPNVKEARKLNKKGSRGSNNSRDKDNLDVVLVEHTSLMKAAIPVLPSCLAIFCLICNLFVPGFGTLISGMLCLCFGKPRFSSKDTPKNRLGSFIVNTIIAIAQLFTVVFCLVGWGWSIWWGVIMYKLSRRQKRLKLAEKNQKEAEGSNVNHNHVDVEQG